VYLLSFQARADSKKRRDRAGPSSAVCNFGANAPKLVIHYPTASSDAGTTASFFPRRGRLGFSSVAGGSDCSTSAPLGSQMATRCPSASSLRRYGRPRPPAPPEEEPPSNSPPGRYATQRAQTAQGAQRLQTDPLQGESALSGPSVLHTSQGGIAKSVRLRVFAFCRRLKAEGRQADDPILHDFYVANKKDLDGLPFDDFRLLVMEGTEKVRSPLGRGGLAEALAEADSRPAPACAAR
jgi:hypothetical protein